MTVVIHDRVKEVTTTTGTGPVTLGGAFNSFDTFLDGIQDGNETYAVFVSGDGVNAEVDENCLYTASGNTLGRGTLLWSTTGSPIALTGTSIVACVTPAALLGVLLASFAGTQTWGGTHDFTSAILKAVTQASSDSSTKVATTAFVAAAVAAALAGVNPEVAVDAATTVAGDTSGLAYANGVAGVGATLTGSVNTAVTIDGFTFTAVGQRLLVKNDTQSPSGAFNGVYQLTQLQTVSLPPVFTRATNYDTPALINETGVVPVINGTANADTSWLLTSKVTTVGTSPLTYLQFTVAASSIVTTSTFAGGDLTGLYPNPSVGANKVTLAKIQVASGNAILIGAQTAGGNYIEVTLDPSTMAMTGGVLKATASGGGPPGSGTVTSVAGDGTYLTTSPAPIVTTGTVQPTPFAQASLALAATALFGGL